MELETGNSAESANQESAAALGGEQAPVVDEKIVKIAKAVGWKEGGPLDAEAFLESMPTRFHDQTKTMQELKKSVDGITKHFAKTVETHVKERISEMETAKEAAIKAGNVEVVRQIDKEIKEIEREAVVDVDRPDIADFKERNSSWFGDDPEMTEAAFALNAVYAKLHPTASDKKVLEYVETKIKAAFPEKFTTAEAKPEKGKPEAAAVESPNSSAGRSEPWQGMKAKMNAFEKEAMTDMLKQTINGKPVTTEKAYIESLMAAGAFEGRK